MRKIAVRATASETELRQVTKSSDKANLTYLSPAALKIQHKASGLLPAKVILSRRSTQVTVFKGILFPVRQVLVGVPCRNAVDMKLSMSVLRHSSEAYSTGDSNLEESLRKTHCSSGGFRPHLIAYSYMLLPLVRDIKWNVTKKKKNKENPQLTWLPCTFLLCRICYGRSELDVQELMSPGY